MELNYQYSNIGKLQYQISNANQINSYHSFKGEFCNYKFQYL